MPIHRWSGSYEIGNDVWKTICSDVGMLINAFNTPEIVVTKHGYDQTPPEVSADAIWLNQIYPPDTNVLTMDFIFTRYEDSTTGYSCNTKSGSYDKLVMAILAVIIGHTTVLQITQTSSRSRWDPAVAWASRVLQRPVHVPRTIAD